MAKLKRKLIASFVYDLGTSETAVYAPCVSIYWDIADENIKIFVRYAWQDFTTTVSFYQFKSALKKMPLTDLPKYDISERTRYKGNFDLENEHPYISDFGKAVMAANSQEQVMKWIENGVKF